MSHFQVVAGPRVKYFTAKIILDQLSLKEPLHRFHT